MIQQLAYDSVVARKWCNYAESLIGDLWDDIAFQADRSFRQRPQADVMPALVVDETNCHDAKQIFQHKLWAEVEAVPRKPCWQEMRVVLGQFIYLCIHLDIVDIYDVTLPGSIYHIFTAPAAVDSFLRHLLFTSAMHCGSEESVVLKARLLLVVAETAEEIEAGSETCDLSKLNGMYDSISRLQKVADGVHARISHPALCFRQRMLTRQHFRAMKMKSAEMCKSLMTEWSKDDGILEDIFNKWQKCFLCALFLSSPGYCATGYTNLVCPSSFTVQYWRDNDAAGLNLPLSLMSLAENANSSVCVYVPADMLEYIVFHVEVALPAVFARFRDQGLSTSPSSMFVNLTTAELWTNLDTEAVVVRFVSFVLRDYISASFRDIRASYGYITLELCNSASLTDQEEKDRIHKSLAEMFGASLHEVRDMAALTARCLPAPSVWRIARMIAN